MKLCAISANLGGYDQPAPWIDQVLPAGVELEIHRLNDQNFPGRVKAMQPALKAGIAKMCGADLFKGADYYLWVDASCALRDPQSVGWFLRQIGTSEIALFRHPDRKTIREEYLFVKQKLAERNEYLTLRYEDEWLDQQYEVVASDAMFRDQVLYASTAFIYRPTAAVMLAMHEWLYNKFRYLLHDQIALPWVLDKYGVEVSVIEEHYMKTPYLTFTRKSRWQRRSS